MASRPCREFRRSMVMRWLLLLGCVAAFVLNFHGAEPAGDEARKPSPEEIIAQLDGFVLARTEGGWIQVKMNGMSLAVAFYNEKAEATALDVEWVLARFIFPGRQEQRRVLIPMDDANVLSHGQPFRPPHVFKVLLSFFRGESSEAVESYTIDYH